MASKITQNLGAAITKLIGMVALGAAVLTVLRHLARLEAGTLVSHPLGLIMPAAIVLLSLLVAAMFLIPAVRRRTLRRRDSAFARFLHGSIVLIGVGLIFLMTSAMVAARMNDENIISVAMVLVGFPVMILVFLLFLSPGAYARHLAEEFNGVPVVPTEDLSSLLLHDDNFIPELATPEQTRQRLISQTRTAKRQPDLMTATTKRRQSSQRSWRMSWSIPFVAVPFAIFFIGMIAGSHAHFIPNAAQTAFAQEYLIPMCIGAALIGGVTVALDRTNSSKIESPPARFILLTPALFAVAYVFGKSFLTIGAPVIHSQFNKDKAGQLSVRVTSIGRERKRRSCDYILYAQAAGAYQGHEFKLCDVPRNIWDGAQPGQRLRLEGFETAYGFRYSEIRR